MSDDKIFCLRFNQNCSKFIIGHNTGFKIYDANTLELIKERELKGGVGLICMLQDSNIIALRGGGKDPVGPANRVMIWDENQERFVANLKFKKRVTGIKMTSSKLGVSTLMDYFVFDTLGKISKLFEMPTPNNPTGTFLLEETSQGKSYTAFPVLTKENVEEKGVICVRNLEKTFTGNDSILLKCHKNYIQNMCFSADVGYLAIAPKDGNIIRIFNLRTGKLTKEVRRSFMASEISSMSFDRVNGDWLLVSDNFGDSEIFYVHKDRKNEAELNMIQNRRSIFKFLGGIIPYFNSEWSFASYRNAEEIGGVSRFLGDGTFTIVSKNGNVCKLNFDKIFGGDCLEVNPRKNFLILNTDVEV